MASLGSPPTPPSPLVHWGPTPSPSPFCRLPCRGNSSDQISPEDTPEEQTKAPEEQTKARQKSKPDFTEELLAKICAPHIERMIQALYHAVEAQLRQNPVETPDLDDYSYRGVSSISSAFPSLFDESAVEDSKVQEPVIRNVGRGGGGDCLVRDLGNMPANLIPHGVKPFRMVSLRESADVGHFCVPSPEQSHSSSSGALVLQPGQHVVENSAPSPAVGAGSGASPINSTTPAGRAVSVADAAAASGVLEKSTMVCRHWKSKGLCKMGEDCKFLHPGYKRGSETTSRNVSHSGAADSASLRGRSRARNRHVAKVPTNITIAPAVAVGLLSSSACAVNASVNSTTSPAAAVGVLPLGTGVARAPQPPTSGSSGDGTRAER